MAPVNYTKAPGGLGCCPFEGGDSFVIVDPMYFALFVGILFVFVFFNLLLCVLSSFAIILKRKRELVALLLLSCRCLAAVYVLWLFFAVPCVGLQCLFMVFTDHTHLHF